MQTNTENTGQPLTTGNPQDIGGSNVFSQQSDLQSTVDLNALSNNSGIRLHIAGTSQSDVQAYVQQQADPKERHYTKSDLLFGIGALGVVLAVVLWVIGNRAQNSPRSRTS